MGSAFPSRRARAIPDSTSASERSRPPRGDEKMPMRSYSAASSRPKPEGGRKYTISTGDVRLIRSRRPMRCSTAAGSVGRSKRTSRRQNSKLRPSPPASVETRIDGPSARRNSATSTSPRSGVSSSWKIATLLRVADSSRALRAERVARSWTKTSVFAEPSARQTVSRAAIHATRGSSASAASSPVSPSAAGARSRSTGRGTRGCRPPMSTRRVALVQGGSGSPFSRDARNASSLVYASGRRSSSRRKNPCASASSGVAERRRTCRAARVSGATAR